MLSTPSLWFCLNIPPNFLNFEQDSSNLNHSKKNCLTGLCKNTLLLFSHLAKPNATKLDYGWGCGTKQSRDGCVNGTNFNNCY